jgi:hypothetical protein
MPDVPGSTRSRIVPDTENYSPKCVVRCLALVRIECPDGEENRCYVER